MSDDDGAHEAVTIITFECTWLWTNNGGTAGVGLGGRPRAPSRNLSPGQIRPPRAGNEFPGPSESKAGFSGAASRPLPLMGLWAEAPKNEAEGLGSGSHPRGVPRQKTNRRAQ
jgi:hypothetical protein